MTIVLFINLAGFFLDVNLFKVNKEKAAEISKESNLLLLKHSGASSGESSITANGLADEDANLMIKLKFLTYKVNKTATSM